MDTRVLKTFMLVAELLNITQAAEKLNFSQPTVTAQIQSLEEHFGVLLFNRVGKRLFLTQAGQELVERSRKILSECQETEQAMGAFREKRQELTLAVSTQMINYNLPVILAKFQNSLPMVTVNVAVCMNIKEVVDGVLESRFDFGLIHGESGMGQLLQYGVWTEDILWVGSRKMIAEHKGDPNVIHYPIVNYTEGTVFRQIFDSVMGHQDYQSTLEYSDSEAVKRAVLHGLGVSFLPRPLIQKYLDDGTLMPLSWGPRLDLRISVVMCRKSMDHPAAQAFLATLAECPTADAKLKELSTF